MHITLLTVGCQKEQKLKGLMFWIPFSHKQASKWKWLCTWYWQEKEHSCKSITTLTWTHCGWANGDQKHWIHQLQCWMHRFNQEIYTNLSLSKLWHQMRKESRMKIEESSRLSPEASNTEVSDRRRIDGKVDRKKGGPREFRRKKCQNECCIDWTE